MLQTQYWLRVSGCTNIVHHWSCWSNIAEFQHVRTTCIANWKLYQILILSIFAWELGMERFNCAKCQCPKCLKSLMQPMSLFPLREIHPGGSLPFLWRYYELACVTHEQHAQWHHVGSFAKHPLPTVLCNKYNFQFRQILFNFGQIHLSIYTNTICNLCKDNLQTHE